VTERLDVSARMAVRPGKLEGFKRQASECIRLTKERDSGTLRYDWFLSSDQTSCEIREAYASSDALMQHRANIGEALDKLFTEFADDHQVVIYGEPSKKLFEMVNVMMAGRIKWYSFLQGLT
jgi:quinol monooxygenase YgiN